MALGFGLLAWICLLFSPLAFFQTAQAQDADYGTVVGIVRSSLRRLFITSSASPCYLRWLTGVAIGG